MPGLREARLRRELRRRVLDLGQPEIQNLEHPAPGSDDVFGLEVAMDDATVMGGQQGARDLGGSVERGVGRQGSSP